MGKLFGTPTPSQLEKINALAKRPLKAEDVFVFSDKAIGDGLIPTRFMRAHKSLLEIFKRDAKSGVSLLLDHSWSGGFFGSSILALAYGRTFDSVLRKTDDHSETDETWGLVVDHYIVRGREKNGISTDQLIADIEDGTLFDTSVGFGNSTYECSICGKSYFSCDHWRGREYEGEMCEVLLKPPGFLMENSLVFDGAYPGAGVLSSMSAEKMENYFDPVEDVKGFDEGTRFIHTLSSSRGNMNTFLYKEPVKGIVVPDMPGEKLSTIGGGDRKNAGISNRDSGDKHPGKEEGDNMELQSQVFSAVLEAIGIAQEDTESMTAQQIMEQLSNKWKEEAGVGAGAGADAFTVTEADVRRALGLTEQADQSIPENWSAKVVQLANEGRESRVELINDTLEWGVRAEGNEFAMEAYREILSEPTRTVQAIKDIREQFKNKANEALKAGRVSTPQQNNKEGREDGQRFKRVMPSEAFSV